ncbi:MAG: hypothetical protein HY813_01830 [Candidatus Portnoybacteria bacterium]|nr:hypothetical protein [Candidatus Portnoybacteria bacterium]
MGTKEKINLPMAESSSQPDTGPGIGPDMSNMKWFDFLLDLSEKGGLKNAAINGPSLRDEQCKGRTAEGTIFHIWRTSTFFILDMDKKDDHLVSAIVKVFGRQPTRYDADPKTEHYVAEWEWKEDPSTNTSAVNSAPNGSGQDNQK